MSRDDLSLHVRESPSSLARQVAQALSNALKRTEKERPMKVTINININYASGGGATVNVGK